MSAEVDSGRGSPWAGNNALRTVPASCLSHRQLGRLCVHVYLCVCMCPGVCQCLLHVCMPVKAKDLRCFPQDKAHLCIFFPLRKLSLAWDSPIQLGCLAKELQESVSDTMSGFIHEFWRSNSGTHMSSRSSLAPLCRFLIITDKEWSMSLLILLKG